MSALSNSKQKSGGLARSTGVLSKEQTRERPREAEETVDYQG